MGIPYIIILNLAKRNSHMPSQQTAASPYKSVCANHYCRQNKNASPDSWLQTPTQSTHQENTVFSDSALAQELCLAHASATHAIHSPGPSSIQNKSDCAGGANALLSYTTCG